MTFIVMILVEFMYILSGAYVAARFGEVDNVKIMLAWPILFVWCVVVAMCSIGKKIRPFWKHD